MCCAHPILMEWLDRKKNPTGFVQVPSTVRVWCNRLRLSGNPLPARNLSPEQSAKRFREQMPLESRDPFVDGVEGELPEWVLCLPSLF